MSDPTSQNRLSDAPSPYLRQHADNPVNWQPWDQQALQAAKERDVPIFLSIGYAACHWCHVMAEESFESEEIAELLNNNFVPIKVDREERPAIDDVYMRVHQMVRGGGGWPLSVFLTPDLEPFYVGTYFPPTARRNQPGFKSLLEDIVENWTDPAERSEIEARAQQWATALQSDMSIDAETETSLEDSILGSAAESLISQADREHGGFGTGQKFPHPARLNLLLRAYRRNGTTEAREVTVETLDAMAKGALRDHVGGGFHRYCTDRTWTEPHFEKMLYDNATLSMAFLDGYRVTGTDRYAQIAEETLHFLDRELRHQEGPFFSSLDARSGGEEGAYYQFTRSEVKQAVSDAGLTNPDRAIDIAAQHWGITSDPTVPRIHRDIGELADAQERSESIIRDEIMDARQALLSYRSTRDRPPRDEKVLAGWNGLVLSAMAAVGLTWDPKWAREAERTLDTLLEWLQEEDSLARRYADGEVGISAHLEDYAYLCRGALNVFEATGNKRHLGAAIDLADAMIEHCYEAETGHLYDTGTDADTPVARPMTLRDGSTPSPVGVATTTLLALDPVAPDRDYGGIAETIIATTGRAINQSPSEYATVIAAHDRLRRGVIEVTVAGWPPESWRRTVTSRFEPDRVLYHRPAEQPELRTWVEELELDEIPVVWADRETRETSPTAYVCRRSCSPPLEESTAVVSWLDRFG